MAVKTMTQSPARAPARAVTAGTGTGRRLVPHRRLHRDNPALYEIMGENSGRATQRAATATQYRLSRVREFRAGKKT
jgi:hypothetical protein